MAKCSRTPVLCPLQRSLASWRCALLCNRCARHMPCYALYMKVCQSCPAHSVIWGTGSGLCCLPSCRAPSNSRSTDLLAVFRFPFAHSSLLSARRTLCSLICDPSFCRILRLGQVASTGTIKVVSGVGGKDNSFMTLGGGKGLGPDGARRLSDLLHEHPPPFFTLIDIR